MKNSTNPLDWFLAASDSILGSILLFSLAMSLGVASILDNYWDFESLFFLYIGWPLLIPGTLFNGGWGLLIIPLIGIILSGKNFCGVEFVFLKSESR